MDICTLPPLSRRAVMASGTLAAAAAALSALPGGPASAAPGQAGGRRTASPEGIIRTTLQSTRLPGGQEFRLILDEFPAGVVVPSHTHPVVGLNYVLQGTLESHYAGEDVLRLGPGDSFVDHADREHILFRNLSDTEPLIVLLSYVIAPGQPFFVPKPQP